MPEPNKRVVVKGIGPAEKEFDRYVRERVLAERSGADLEREMRDLERKAQDLERAARSGP